MATIDQLKWATLTAVVNEIKSPSNFLKNRLWSNFETLPTEVIEVSTLHGPRVMAPFVKRDGKSIMVAGRTSTSENISAPNIRISRPLKPSALLFDRAPGTVIFADAATIGQSIDDKIAKEMAVLADQIAEREEWMCAMALANTLTYTSDDAHFDITFARAAGQNDLSVATDWDNSAAKPYRDFDIASRLVSDAVGLGVTDVILGSNAAQALIENPQVATHIQQRSGFTAGEISLQNQYRDDGALLIGTLYNGIAVWKYLRTVVDHLGNTVKMIRDDYAEFVAVTPAAERVMYYAAIPDMEALQGGLWQGRRFAKSWTTKDPSAQMALIHTRPFPVPRRPNAAVSMKVVNT